MRQGPRALLLRLMPDVSITPRVNVKRTCAPSRSACARQGPALARSLLLSRELDRERVQHAPHDRVSVGVLGDVAEGDDEVGLLRIGFEVTEDVRVPGCRANSRHQAELLRSRAGVVGPRAFVAR